MFPFVARRTQSYYYAGTLTALAPIAHFGESTGGIEQNLRRVGILLPTGRSLRVPQISGNAWRGQIRDAGMLAMLNTLEVYIDSDIRLSKAVFYLLFSGGALTKESGRGVDMDLVRQLRELIPLLSVLGGAVGRQILAGKVSFSEIMPVCRETAHLLPEELRTHPMADKSISDMLDVLHFTRMDDAKRETLAGAYLSLPDQILLEAPKVKKIAKKGGAEGETEEIAAASGTAQQMRYGFEVFIPGTVFSASINLMHATRLEYEALLMGLAAWSQKPVLGGKSGIGLGTVSMQFADWVKLDPLLQRDTTEVGAPLFTELQTFFTERKAEIVQLLYELGTRYAD